MSRKKYRKNYGYYGSHGRYGGKGRYKYGSHGRRHVERRGD
ncbi:hypothetical protein [Fictibacillus macauensis]|nr:hypothetical protein [Fictibacillus macauensis]